MDTKEYIDLLEQYEQETRMNPAASDLNEFITVWVKSRKPELFKELEHDFKDKESTVYAYRECKANQLEF